MISSEVDVTLTKKNKSSPYFTSVVHFLQRQNHSHKILFHHPISTHPPRHHVLYLHGTGNDAEFLLSGLVEHLTQENIMVMNVDLEGHGKDSRGIWTDQIHSYMDDVMSYLAQHQIPSVHLVGHSLGGVIGLLSYGRNLTSSRYLSLTCLAVPPRVRMRRLYKEGFILTRRDYWRCLIREGLTSSLPAIGSFRRRSFPIRMDQKPYKMVSYPLTFARWIDSQDVEKKLREVYDHSPESVMWFEARWDGLSRPLSNQLKSELVKGGAYQSFATTHLGILLAVKMHRELSQRILSLPSSES